MSSVIPLYYFLQILCDLLSPDNLKEGLKESSWSSLPCSKNKPFGFPAVVEEPHSPGELSLKQVRGGKDDRLLCTPASLQLRPHFLMVKH